MGKFKNDLNYIEILSPDGTVSEVIGTPTRMLSMGSKRALNVTTFE